MTSPGTPHKIRDPHPISARFCPECNGCFRNIRIQTSAGTINKRRCDTCGHVSGGTDYEPKRVMTL